MAELRLTAVVLSLALGAVQAFAQSPTDPPARMDPPQVIERGLAAVRASWPDVATEAVPVTGYDLQYRRSGDDDWTDGPQDQTGTHADITSLETDADYEVRVRAANGAGDGAWSEPAEGFTAFWTATLGVGRLSYSPNGYLGYQRRAYNKFGSLTPHSFTYDGVEYDIFILSLYRGSRTDSDGVHTRALDFYVIEHAFPEDWALRVDDAHYRIGDASRGTFPSYDDYGRAEKYYWTYPAFDPEHGASYEVAFSRLPENAAGAQAAPKGPLTAAFGNHPAAHDGSTPFDVELRFGEEVNASYAWFTDSVLTLSGARVTGARRLSPGSNKAWSIRVAPEGDAAAVLTLPANRDCSERGAICTADGRTLAHPVKLTVPGPAQPPVISGPSTFEVTEGETAVATLQATDPDTETADLEWSIPAAAGADGAHFALTNAGALTFNAAKDFESPDDANGDGAYEVAVQVGDGGRTDSASLTVTLTNRNEAPAAEAGADQANVAGGTTVTLSGSGSDPDAGDTLSYQWTQTGGTVVTLSGGDAATATFEAPTGLAADETLTFRLRVTDADGLHGEDSTSVGVETAPPLTGAFRSVPASHDGSSAFWMELHFSEEVELSYRAFKNGLVRARGATLGRARRLAPPSSIGWHFPVRPEGDGDVTVTLFDGRRCHAVSGPCTADGRRLSASVSVTVRGPPPAQVAGLAVAAQVESLSASWTGVAGADGYRLQWREDAGAYDGSNESTVPDGLTSRRITDLAVDTAYWVRVAATRSGRPDGPWSAEAAGTPFADGEDPAEGDVRLVGGAGPHEGRVEILRDGRWGTVCDDYWSRSDARVACRQLGHSDASEAPRQARFGAGSGPIWMDNLRCVGDEARLADCPFNGWGEHNCGHDEDAGAVCVTGVAEAVDAADRAGAAAKSREPAPGGGPTLDRAVASALVGTPASSLNALDLTDRKLNDLRGIERLTELRTLRLRGNALSDLTPLSGLTKLRELDLSDNAVADLWPLAGLTRLRRLDVSDNAVTDLSPLMGLGRLEVLVLNDNAVRDLGPLTHLAQLTQLRASRNRVADAAPLHALAGLRELALSGNALSDLSPLAGLGELERLHAANNRIGDASPLWGLRNLRALDLSGNRLASLDGLSGLGRLRVAWLDRNELASLRAPVGLESLAALSLRGNRIGEAGPLEGLPVLRWLDLSGNPVSVVPPHVGRSLVVWLDAVAAEPSAVVLAPR